MIGEINQSNLYLLLPSKVGRLAEMINRREHLTILDAIGAVYRSGVYRRLEDENAKLWHLGPVAMYEEMTE